MARRINLKQANVARSKTIRDINRQIILNHIREAGLISRADIARLTALQRSTVSLIVDELLELGLVVEIYGESSGGRPPQLLSLRIGKAVAIGVDIGKKRTIVGTCDLSGRLLKSEEFPTSPNFSESMKQIIEAARHFIDKNNGSIEQIGVSVPGMVENWDGEVLLIPHLNWHKPKIAEKLEKATGLSVKIENDSNAAALAELWLGRPEAANVRDFIVVLIDSGIGTGVVFDGQIYRGKGGVAGEFGHMTIGRGAPSACSAGRDNCWEAFASERAALARFEALSGSGNQKGSTTFAELVDLALENNRPAAQALRETAYYVGVGISNLIQGLSPEVTVVAGTIVKAWSLIGDDITKAAEEAVCQGYPPVRIMPSTLGSYPSLMGAFSLILVDTFALTSRN